MIKPRKQYTKRSPKQVAQAHWRLRTGRIIACTQQLKAIAKDLGCPTYHSTILELRNALVSANDAWAKSRGIRVTAQKGETNDK